MTDPPCSAIGVDAHCHVDLYASPQQIVDHAEVEKICTIAVTNAPSVFRHTKNLVTSARYVRPALGLHPELVKSHARELDLMFELLPETRFVGEIGLDFVTKDAEERRSQLRVFEAILKHCADAGDKVLTIHSRRASAEVVAAVGQSFPGRVILHWFSGPLRDLQRAINAGMYFSVNPAMVRSTNGQKLIAAMPRDRVLTETDGPFVEITGRAATPRDTAEILPHLAALWRCTAEEARESVMATFLRMVGSF